MIPLPHEEEGGCKREHMHKDMHVYRAELRDVFIQWRLTKALIQKSLTFLNRNYIQLQLSTVFIRKMQSLTGKKFLTLREN